MNVTFSSDSYESGTCVGAHNLTLETLFHGVENNENELYEAVFKNREK